jgi:hypothetical protein
MQSKSTRLVRFCPPPYYSPTQATHEAPRAIAHDRIRFELEFAVIPDRSLVDRSLLCLADRDVVRRAIDLMIEEGAA